MRDELSRNQITHMAVEYLGLKFKRAITQNTVEAAYHCPFHKDRTPSAFINFDMGVFNCFSCGRSGSIETLFKEMTGENLYKALGISNDPFSNYARAQSYENKFYSYLSEDIGKLDTNVYFNIEETDEAWDRIEAREYLKRRGITEIVSKAMNMRYSSFIYINGRQFGGRLLIPIYEDNKLISVEGRRIRNTDEIKVLYPKGSSVNTLYDLDNLNKEEPLYVVEGLMDLAVLRSCKYFENSTSIFGASLTKRQLLLLREFSKVIMIPDLDEPGLKVLDTLRSIQKGNIYYLKLPKEIEGISIKDIGDLGSNNIDICDLLNRKWTKYIKYLE